MPEAGGGSASSHQGVVDFDPVTVRILNEDLLNAVGPHLRDVDWADNWRPVVGALADHGRVCGWDRAGYGFSGASPKPQDVIHTEWDLEAALRAAGIGPPFILVAHSLGAYEALLFADHRLAQVSGMVLVDPSFPDQERLVRLSNPEARAFMDRQLVDLVATERRCAS